MALLNPRFENPGPNPGEAEHWILMTCTSGQSIAGFGPEPYRAWEDFERWIEFKPFFEDGDLILGFFDPLKEGFEDFEDAWSNDHFSFELPPGQVITCPFGGNTFEDMHAGWLSQAFAWSWDDVTAIVGVFYGEPIEDFEDHWRGNEFFFWLWADVSSETAMFDGEPWEAFETGWYAAARI
ncbi:MAG: hypothetical protein QNJ97_27830 [Myxococcota bacterium]|nr:hypothetical protein [Myxococcota bacterium]